jgi:hypothetical protein
MGTRFGCDFSQLPEQAWDLADILSKKEALIEGRRD